MTGVIPVIPTDDQGVPLPLEEQPELDPAGTGVALAGDGRLMNSGPLNGLSKSNAIRKAIELLEEGGVGRASRNYRLRDWLISRQRYWGTPIPIIHCPHCGEVPVPETDLPVRLPDAAGLDLSPKGTSPLGGAEEWSRVT